MESLQSALDEPEIARRVDFNLKGKTLVDQVINIVEEEISRCPENLELNEIYNGLRRDYPLHFSSGGEKGREGKNPSYKSCNGF